MLAEMLLPGCLLRGDPERPADGLLRAGPAYSRRPRARGRDALRRRQSLRLVVDAGRLHVGGVGSGAWRRVVLDNLQWLADPNADRSFKAQAARAKRNGAAFWLAPGSLVVDQ